MKRRTFLQTTGGLGAGLIAASNSSEAAAGRSKDRLPREVWVATLSMEKLRADKIDALLDRLFGRMEETLSCEPDIICVPEVFLFPGVSHSLSATEVAEELPGPITERFAEFSKVNKCYTICPIHTKQEGKIYNSAVLIDRQGEVAGVYNKIHPTTGEISSGVQPGSFDQSVIKTDFGRIGMQICFDVNWADGWYPLKQADVEIIFWPSAFSGGRMLNGWAWNTQSHVVTSTWNNPSRIIDITGDEIASTGRYENWCCAPVNLEKAMIHTWPYTDQIIALREKYKQDVRVKRLHDEGWTIIESRSPDLTVKAILKEFEIPLHREHIALGDQAQKEKRGV